MLEIKTLGYPRIYVDNNLLEDFLSSKVIVLLCYLALNPQTHSRERLAGLFWGDMPESKAKSNLRQALHDLSKKLGDHVQITRQSVQICQNHCYSVDAIDLKHIVYSENPSAEDLRQVVNYYHGQFLEGINQSVGDEIDDWLLNERELLRLTYIDALSHLSQQYLIAGQWSEAEQQLRKLAIVEPLREATHRQIMICLARQQRYTESIKHYEELEAILAKELAVEPSFESKRIRDCILSARIRKPDSLLSNLDALFGREQEINTIEASLIHSTFRLVTLTGQGGIGKTHLAQHITARNQMLFMNGAYYISLEPINTPDELVSTLCAELNVSFTATREALQSLIGALQHQEVLITLDNFEHLLEATSIIAEILNNTHHVKILITSRERLNLKQEQVIHLVGLPIPLAEHWHVSSARQLFETRAQQLKPDFTITNSEAFIHLCQHVEGMPLALELAAGWLDIYPLENIVTEIKSDLSMLTSPQSNRPSRHQSVHRLFDQTWQHFSSEQQDMLMNLTIFRGSFSADAVRSIAGISHHDLRNFVVKSWVKVTGEGRYNLHMLIRQYLQEMIAKTNYDTHTLAEKHAQFFADFLDQFEGKQFATPYTIGAMEIMLAESDNLRQAWNYAVEHIDLPAISKMLEGYYAFFTQQTWFSELVTTLKNLLSKIEHQADELLLARIYCRLARTDYYLNSRRGDARIYFEKSLELAQNVDDKVEIGHALHGLAACHMVTDWDACMCYLEQCIMTYEQAGDGVHAALAKNTQAEIYHFLGKRDESGMLFQQSYEALKAADDSRLLTPLRLWAGHESEAGHFEQARALFGEYLAIMEKIGGIHIEVYALQGLADIAFRCEDYDEAKRYYEEAWIVSQQATPSLDALNGLARVAVRQAEFAHAKEYFSRALRNENDPDWYIRVLTDTVELLIAAEEIKLARAMIYLIHLHPITVSTHHENIKYTLERYNHAHENIILHVTDSEKLTYIKQYIPHLAQILATPESFFNARLNEIEEAHLNTANDS